MTVPIRDGYHFLTMTLFVTLTVPCRARTVPCRHRDRYHFLTVTLFVIVSVFLKVIVTASVILILTVTVQCRVRDRA